MAIDFVSVVITLIACKLIYFVYRFTTRPRNYPPGPLGVPVLGSLHLIKNRPELATLELAKKYGNVFSLKFFCLNFVSVCGFEANRDMLNNEAICDRRVGYIFRMLKGQEPNGIIHNDYNQDLKAYRVILYQFFTETNCVERAVKEKISQTMRDMENSARNETKFLLRTITERISLDVHLGFLFSNRIKNRSSKDELKYKELGDAFFSLAIFYIDKLFMIPDAVPGLQNFWIPDSAKKFLASANIIINHIRQEIQSHRKDFNPENARDFVDYFLKKIDDEKSSQTPDRMYTEKALLPIICDIILGSTETTYKAIEYGVLYLAGHPSIQQKLHEEIIKVLGRKKEVKWSDKLEMPYANATVHEVLRNANPAPMGVARKTVRDIIFHGYTIPKGTTFLPNTYSCHYEKSMWKNPNNFDPENFLSEVGEFQRNEAFCPYGGGMRKCPGALVANQLMFVFLVTLVQKFRILPESDDVEIDYSPEEGNPMTEPKRQRIRLVSRN